MGGWRTQNTFSLRYLGVFLMWNVQLSARKMLFTWLSKPNIFWPTNCLRKAYPRHAQEALPGSLTMAERLIWITCASPRLTESTSAKHGCIFFIWQHRDPRRFLSLWKQNIKEICGLIEIAVWAGWRRHKDTIQEMSCSTWMKCVGYVC